VDALILLFSPILLPAAELIKEYPYLGLILIVWAVVAWWESVQEHGLFEGTLNATWAVAVVMFKLLVSIVIGVICLMYGPLMWIVGGFLIWFVWSK
jgi:hypothetical protein